MELRGELWIKVGISGGKWTFQGSCFPENVLSNKKEQPMATLLTNTYITTFKNTHLPIYQTICLL